MAEDQKEPFRSGVPKKKRFLPAAIRFAPTSVVAGKSHATGRKANTLPKLQRDTFSVANAELMRCNEYSFYSWPFADC